MSPFGLDPVAHPKSAANRHSNGRTGIPGSFDEGGGEIGRAMEDELRREGVWRWKGDRWGRDKQREDKRRVVG